MTRISIVGISGSGKSTLANRLSKKLNIKAIHLDMYFWNVDWTERYSRADFKKVSDEFSDRDEWIIDGNYRSSIDHRFERSDIIIFLDYPKWRCVWRVCKRVFSGKQPFDKAEGTKEKVGWHLIRYIIKYPTHEMRERVNRYSDGRLVYVAKSDKEIEMIIEKITKT